MTFLASPSWNQVNYVSNLLVDFSFSSLLIIVQEYVVFYWVLENEKSSNFTFTK